MFAETQFLQPPLGPGRYFSQDRLPDRRGNRRAFRWPSEGKSPVDINKIIFDYDQILILGPVFPHEVVGYSGGAKYLFPGISGGEFLHFFHWLGAVVTCPGTIGIKHTPVREVINRAMKLIDVPVHCISMVVKSSEELYGIYAGRLS